MLWHWVWKPWYYGLTQGERQGLTMAPGHNWEIKLAVGRLRRVVQLYWDAFSGWSKPFKAGLEERVTESISHYKKGEWALCLVCKLLCINFCGKEANQLSTAEAIKRPRFKRHSNYVEITSCWFNEISGETKQETGSIRVLNSCYLTAKIKRIFVYCNATNAGWKIH